MITDQGEEQPSEDSSHHAADPKCQVAAASYSKSNLHKVIKLLDYHLFGPRAPAEHEGEEGNIKAAKLIRVKWSAEPSSCLQMRMLQIGFCVYRATASLARLDAAHFTYNYDCGTSGPYINYREVFARCGLCSFAIHMSTPHSRV